jgi:hypothetical protein
MSWIVGVQFLAGERVISLLHSIQTSSGVHPASFPTDTEDSFSEVKEDGA